MHVSRFAIGHKTTLLNPYSCNLLLHIGLKIFVVDAHHVRWIMHVLLSFVFPNETPNVIYTSFLPGAKLSFSFFTMLCCGCCIALCFKFLVHSPVAY